MPEKKLPVPYHEQETSDYCGPATIQMILDYHKLTVLQDTLWAEIQSTSTCHAADPEHASRKSSAGGNYLWVEQRCECWGTSPEDSRTVINQHAPHLSRLKYFNTSSAAFDALVTSVDADRPPAASVEGFNHWIVIYGYVLDGAGDDEDQRKDGYAINAFYVMDPLQPKSTDAQRMVTLDDFDLGAMSCGPHRNHYPVIVGA